MKYFHIETRNWGVELYSTSRIGSMHCSVQQYAKYFPLSAQIIGTLVNNKKSRTCLFFVAAGAFLLRVRWRVQPGWLRHKHLLAHRYATFLCSWDVEV